MVNSLKIFVTLRKRQRSIQHDLIVTKAHASFNRHKARKRGFNFQDRSILLIQNGS